MSFKFKSATKMSPVWKRTSPLQDWSSVNSMVFTLVSSSGSVYKAFFPPHPNSVSCLESSSRSVLRQRPSQAMPPPSRPQRYEEFHAGTVRYGIFAKSRYTGIFRYGISLVFHPRICWKFFIFLLFGAISGQFREFPQLHTQVAQK